MREDSRSCLWNLVRVTLLLSLQKEEDGFQLEHERGERIRALLDQQAREIEEFDAKSLEMGFSTVVITNYGDQVNCWVICFPVFYS